MYCLSEISASIFHNRYNISMGNTNKTQRRLHIGGKHIHPEWEIFDAREKEFVDHIGDAADLSRFSNGTFTMLYASHVLEHFPYLRQLVPTLKEWARVLTDDGQMLISVPDMDVLCRMFLDKKGLAPEERLHVMRILFGGQSNQYDFHYAGLNMEILTNYAQQAGLKVSRQVRRFGLFPDHSDYQFAGKFISLNVVLVKA